MVGVAMVCMVGMVGGHGWHGRHGRGYGRHGRGGHGRGSWMGKGNLVMRYIIKIRNVEKTTC